MNYQRKLLWVMAAETVVIIALTAAGVQAFIRQDSQQSITACQQRYVGALSGVLAARARIGDESRTATQIYNHALAAAGSGSDAHAYTVYAASIAHVNAMLNATPIPATPVCR